ncbi:ERMES complex subunit, partial [Coemansia spiralis]
LAADGADSGTASVGSLPRSISQHLIASQLHQRLVELSRKGDAAAGLDHGADSTVQDMHTPPDGLHDFATPRVAAATNMHGQWTPVAADLLEKSPPLRASHRRSISDDLGQYPEMLDRLLADDWGRMQLPAAEGADPCHRPHSHHRGTHEEPEEDAERRGVVLRPSDNAIAARLASLMSMGHTLSPYTRRFTHTTMRADVNPRFGHYAPRHATAAPPDSDLLLLSDGASVGSPPSVFSLPLHSDMAGGGFGASLAAATPFSATTPPGGGVRSPFSRNRALRRKVHRIGPLSLSADAAEP